MNTTYRSAGLVDGPRAAEILRHAACVLGTPDRRMVIGHDASSVELIRLPTGKFQVRVAANDDFGPITPAPAVRAIRAKPYSPAYVAALNAAQALISELN